MEQNEMPISIRATVSLFLAFMLFRVLIMGDPVHAGKGGVIMPRWLGILVVCLFSVVWFKGWWAGVTIADFKDFYYDIRNPGHIQTLDGLRDKPAPYTLNSNRPTQSN